MKQSASRIELDVADHGGSNGLSRAASLSEIPDGVLTLVKGPHRKGTVLFSYQRIGAGPITLVFFAGLGADSAIWHRQIQHFEELNEFTIILFDAWGVGYSSRAMPRSDTVGVEEEIAATAGSKEPPLTTRLMAQDVASFLASIGVTSFHAIGSSLGGMILMQLCLEAPPEMDIRSATFVSTSSGLSIPRLQVIFNVLRHGRQSALTLEDECRLQMFLNHPPNYLLAPSGHPERRNLDILAKYWLWRRKTIPRTSQANLLAQAKAGAGHWVSRSKLKKVAERLENGRGVLVITGQADTIINPRHSLFLARTFGPEATLAVLKGGGHSVHDQLPGPFNELVEYHVLAAEKRRTETASLNQMA
jgi:pimeloyl-ACP methyl ester carboxylesterase